MRRSLPPMAALLGALGLIPFVVCAVGAISGTPGGNLRMLGALLSYGAVILAFLGAVHWGLVLAPAGEMARPAEERTRLVLGVVPALLGWVALLLALVLPPSLGLLVLIAGFLLTALQEMRWSRQELLPRSYMVMRWILTGIVVALLTTVFVVRLLGGMI